MVLEWLCLCAGATAVALEPGPMQRAGKARASPKASLIMEETAFVKKKKKPKNFYTLISCKCTEACVSLIINFNVDSDWRGGERRCGKWGKPFG